MLKHYNTLTRFLANSPILSHISSTFEFDGSTVTFSEKTGNAQINMKIKNWKKK